MYPDGDSVLSETNARHENGSEIPQDKDCQVYLSF